MDINDLYEKLNKIFIDHTTHQWKNEWEHEGDRLSKELSIQERVPYNNLFLLEKTDKGFLLRGPQIKIEVEYDNYKTKDTIRIDIEVRKIADIDIYYYVDNEIDWMANIDFITNLCQSIYDCNVKIKETVSVITSMYGVINPPFVKQIHRGKKLNELLYGNTRK